MSHTDETTIESQDSAVIDVDAIQVSDEQKDHETRSPDRRIKQLELALKQCQVYIDELKAQLSDQAFLEEQLASTEEYSHIQQKAISTLREQLSQLPNEKDFEILLDQRETLGTQIEHQLQSLSELETRCNVSETEVTRLQNRVHQLESELQRALDTDVESTQQRIIAQQTSERLRAEIRSQEEQLKILEERLKKSASNQKRLRVVINALQNAHKSDSQKNLAIRDLSATLLSAQDKIVTLENDLSSQALMQTQLHQASYELEETIKDHIDRAESQEQQIAEMQEQILHQAQESREFETAVQHWKDRAEKYERFLGQLFNVLDALPEEPNQLDQQQYLELIRLRDQSF